MIRKGWMGSNSNSRGSRLKGNPLKLCYWRSGVPRSELAPASVTELKIDSSANIEIKRLVLCDD